MLTLLVALLIFSIVIIFHEFGHFLAARLVGIYAEEFSIGMGPKLFSFSSKGTQFSVRALPIGGFVKFLGKTKRTMTQEPSTMPNCGKDCSRSCRPDHEFSACHTLTDGILYGLQGPMK